MGGCYKEGGKEVPLEDLFARGERFGCALSMLLATLPKSDIPASSVAPGLGELGVTKVRSTGSQLVLSSDDELVCTIAPKQANRVSVVDRTGALAITIESGHFCTVFLGKAKAGYRDGKAEITHIGEMHLIGMSDDGAVFRTMINKPDGSLRELRENEAGMLERQSKKFEQAHEQIERLRGIAAALLDRKPGEPQH